jgi:hypothetical protein
MLIQWQCMIQEVSLHFGEEKTFFVVLFSEFSSNCCNDQGLIQFCLSESVWFVSVPSLLFASDSKPIGLPLLPSLSVSI